MPLNHHQSSRIVLFPDSINEKAICGLAGAMVALVLGGIYFANSYYTKWRKMLEHDGKQWLSEMQTQEQLQSGIPESMRPKKSALDRIFPQLCVREILHKNGKLLAIQVMDIDGSVHGFISKWSRQSSIDFYIRVVALLECLILIWLIVKALFCHSTRPVSFFAMCWTGMCIVGIALIYIYFNQFDQRIDQNESSINVHACWNYWIRSDIRKGEGLPASIEELELPEKTKSHFDRLYYDGSETPESIVKTRAERLLLAPRNCQDSNDLYLAVVMHPINKDFFPRMRLMSGKKINSMIKLQKR